MESSKKKPTTLRADDEMLREAEEIAKTEGLDGFTATVRYCIKQTHRLKVLKEASYG